MTFTYNLTNPNDITRVRYHLGDTDEPTAIYQDEEIAFAISENGGWQRAVISLIKGCIVRLAHEPDMTADWLTINWRRSSDAWRSMLREKQAEFGLGATVNSGNQQVTRVDIAGTE